MTIEDLQIQILNLSSQLSSISNTLNLKLGDIEDDIRLMKIRLSALENEDLQIHQEIHTVSTLLDGATGRVSTLEVKDTDDDSRFDTIEENHSQLEADVEAMDVEHHEELHNLANEIDIHTAEIQSLQFEVDEFPIHEVMTEEEYEALGEPDPDKFYFTFEE